MHEIERKFIVSNPKKAISSSLRSCDIEQCYLVGDTGDWAIRVRKATQNNQIFYSMTLKRKVGHSKSIEVESVIGRDFYDAIAAQCGKPLRKTRHETLVGIHLWEIDFFQDIDLVMAEVELDHEDEEIDIPPWAGKEVTGKKRYSNKNLSREIENEL